MSVTDELVSKAARYAASFHKGDLRARLARQLAVLACMDASLDRYDTLGLPEGDAPRRPVTEDHVRRFAYEVEKGTLREDV